MFSDTSAARRPGDLIETPPPDLASALNPAQREAVDHLSRRMVAKLLHAPLKSARELAGSKQGQLYLTALRELFELSDEP